MGGLALIASVVAGLVALLIPSKVHSGDTFDKRQEMKESLSNPDNEDVLDTPITPIENL